MDLARSLRDASKYAMAFPPPKCQFSGPPQMKSDPLFFHGGDSTHAVLKRRRVSPTQRARRQTNEVRQKGRTTVEAGASNRRDQNAALK